MLSLMREPGLESVDINSEDLISFQKKVLVKKPVLRMAIEDMYRNILKTERDLIHSESGIRLEIGAGASILKTLDSSFMISDIKKSEFVDLSVDACKTTFPENSIQTLVGINCFHHFSQPQDFLNEANRILKPGGILFLVEPYESVLGKIIYKYLFYSETFDMNQTTWETEGRGPMIGANQALSFIVFKRDRVIFERLFPELEIIDQQVVRNYFRYLLSGGFNFKQLLPNLFFHFLKLVEERIGSLAPVFGLHSLWIIRKKC